MSKILFLSLIILLLGAGCSAPEVRNDLVKVKEAQINNKSKNQENNKSMNEENTQINQEDTKRFLDGQKDLAADFSKALIKTNKGNITVEFYSEDSPITVNNFMNLSEQGFYNGTSFHRVIKDFMIQGGDPNSKDQNNRMTHGMGDPGYKFKDEFNSHSLVRGNLAMANSGPNTNGSQFFIVTLDATPWLDGKHVNFGRVIEGMDVVDAIEGVETDARDNPLEPVVIENIELLK